MLPQEQMPGQTSLFEPLASALPDGFTYRRQFLSEEEEQRLLEHVRGLPFREFRIPRISREAAHCLLRLVLRFQWRRTAEDR
jgi:hypothetical protein